MMTVADKLLSTYYPEINISLPSALIHAEVIVYLFTIRRKMNESVPTVNGHARHCHFNIEDTQLGLLSIICKQRRRWTCLLTNSI